MKVNLIIFYLLLFSYIFIGVGNAKANANIAEVYAWENKSLEACLSTLSNLNKNKTCTKSNPELNLKIAQPVVKKDGLLIDNEFYMRPDRLNASFSNNNFVKGLARSATPIEIFTQELACSKVLESGKIISYSEANPDQRKKLFKKSYEETVRLQQIQIENWYAHCGRNCPELVPDGLAVESGEDFADWMSNKALEHYLARKESLHDRREAAGLASADLCKRPDSTSEDSDLAAIEKIFSLESHPNNRTRRISVFNNRNSKLIKCQINLQEQGFGLCER